ncbi:lipoprotein [Spiroplasma endosymbiont of Polydrusus formosus]|uniref:lipoprotein n=1 Tax=Spiroplasma endosymbiont of Polydrusus formosus TaxID=3139326 RepID=UPI0035B52D67
MKKLLSIIGAISLTSTSTIILVACNTSQKYSPEELAKLKEENKINTKNQEIKDNLEWIAPQEKPFNKVDDKWYYVVWKSKNWNITKFKNDILVDRLHTNRELNGKNEDEEYKLNLEWYQQNDIINALFIRSKSVVSPWISNKYRFKSVYRWNLDTKEPDLILDENSNIKVEGE